MSYPLDDILENINKEAYSAFFYTPNIYKDATSYLFSNPAEVIVADKKNFEEKLQEIDELKNKGLSGYGIIPYEYGYLFEDKLKSLFDNNSPVMIFCFFEDSDIVEISSEELEISPNGMSDYKIDNFKLNTSRDDYINSVLKIKEYIHSGDTYQVNYTIKGKFGFKGSIAGLFKSLIFNQSAEFSAYINCVDKIITSVSPELFFKLEKDTIIAKPMKGTSRRGYNIFEDAKTKNELINSVKDRAENVMIVDLLRNDLGIISNYNSVVGTDLYEVLKYESVYQMVSTIKAEPRDKSIKNIIENIFPCGSVTGTPKIRTMEIIKEIEKEERGIYTGSIGLINKQKTTFNVAIRTIEIDKKSGDGVIGLGSGIVWDSQPEIEYEECKLKSRFLTGQDKYFTIFESVLIENGKIFLKDYHFDRFKSAADYFLFKWDLNLIKKAISEIILKLDKSKKYKMKISLHKWGGIEIEYSPVSEEKDTWRLAVSENKICQNNKFQHFKTSNRSLYIEDFKKYSARGFDDVVYFNEMDQLAECARTNIFIEKNGIKYTPPVSAGILNGCYRKCLIDTNDNVVEKDLTVNDLLNAERIFVTNSVRKKVEVSEILYDGKLFQFNY